MINCETIRQILKILSEYTKPNTLAATQLLKKELETLSHPLYGKSIYDYMHLWFTWCSKRDAVGTQADNESTQAWLSSMAPMYGDYVATRTGRLLDKQNDGEVTTLYSELRAWQSYFQHNGDTKFKSKHRTTVASISTAAATELSSSLTRSSSSRPSKPCLCGRNHMWKECYYLNAEYPRPEAWKPRDDTKKKIEKRFKEDKNLKERVDKAIQAYNAA